jgi:tRNA(His) guanylyltransferase
MHSRFEYVRSFEQDDSLLQGAWIVIRIDGRHFHQFSDAHGFSKPNDDRALRLMTVAARAVMNEFSPEVILAIGQSDEYSFVLPRTTSLCNRRSAKLVSTFTSLFTAQYIFNWAKCFPDQTLEYPAR